jgi:hypothetical protein
MEDKIAAMKIAVFVGESEIIKDYIYNHVLFT